MRMLASLLLAVRGAPYTGGWTFVGLPLSRRKPSFIRFGKYWSDQESLLSWPQSPRTQSAPRTVLRDSMLTGRWEACLSTCCLVCTLQLKGLNFDCISV